MTHALSCADISVFSVEIKSIAISRNTHINSIKVFKDCFNRLGYNFDDVSKNGYPSLLKKSCFEINVMAS